MKHIIVGGVAGGATAATQIRRNDEKAEIILFEKGDHISYANCGLPYHIGNVIPDRDNLLLQTPDSFRKRYNIDVRIQSEVVGIDTVEKKITVRKKGGEIYQEKYDKLLLSPGAAAIVPPVSGIDMEGVFSLRNVEDMDKIKSYIRDHSVKNAVVVGAGFIGLEMVENLHLLGIDVSIVEKSSQIHPALDYSMAQLLHDHLQEKGVQIFLEHEISALEKEANGLHIMFKQRDPIYADMVILAIGVKPETTLAVQAGLKIGETGGIWVNEYLQTSAKDIYAVGDVIEYPHPLTGKPWLNLLAGPANRQGTIAADNMVRGNKVKYEGAIGNAIARVFDMTSAATGLNAKKLKEFDIPFKSVYTHGFSHANYFPGAEPLSIKLTFDPVNGKLFGAQIVGHDGIDKRIDLIALLIKKGGTIDDLIQLEQAYAPPYSSAKDPVAIAGYVAKNIMTEKMPVVYWQDIPGIDPAKVNLIDVRERDEFEFGAVQGAVNIPLDEIRDRISEIDRSKPVYVYCQAGMRGYYAQQILLENGFKEIYNLCGGYKTYVTATKSHS